MKTIKAQTGNVFMAYRDIMELNALINGWKIANKPVYDFTASDGIQHTIWVMDRDSSHAKQVTKESFKLLNKPPLYNYIKFFFFKKKNFSR